MRGGLTAETKARTEKANSRNAARVNRIVESIARRKMNCYYCGVELTCVIPKGKTHYSQVKNYRVRDHVFPICLGGKKIPKSINIVDCCHQCNEKKNGTHPLDFYEKNDFSHWNKEKRNDFLWRIKISLLIIGSNRHDWIGHIYHAKEPRWYKEMYRK